jgi:hypothetical protein
MVYVAWICNIREREKASMAIHEAGWWLSPREDYNLQIDLFKTHQSLVVKQLSNTRSSRSQKGTP